MTLDYYYGDQAEQFSFYHIEMSEMIATANAKSIEDIKSFISRAKETYKVPYETHPADRLRQCVFGGSSNTMDFLPLDRSGNRRFLPIMVHAENAKVHILEDEAASRAGRRFPIPASLPSTADSGAGNEPLPATSHRQQARFCRTVFVS